jgi:pimeloyl-ACP methyl ester carboxylesterase
VPHLTLHGIRHHVQRLGTDHPGPPVVLIHGLLVGNLAGWYFTAAPALARTRRVLLYDLRGHGLSDRTATGYDVATLARDLEALIDTDTPGPVTLVGHSYGALIALRYTLDHPERVDRLALVEAPLPPSTAGDIEAFVQQTPEEMAATLPDSVRTTLEGRRRDHRLLATIGALVAETSLVDDLRRETDIPDEILARVACPTLCLYGEDSACAPVGDRLARLIPGARLVRLPGGHYLHLDAPEAVAAHLAEHCGG